MKVLSILTPEEVQQAGGLSSKTICGKFEGDNFSPEFFKENKEFVDFMHTVIANKAAELDLLKQAAMQQKEGYLYVIDFRTPGRITGNIPPEDIIGYFKVENGEVVKNSYQRNGSHKIYTKSGLVKFPPGLDRLMIEELKK